MVVESPYRMLRNAPMSAIASEPKPFNNFLGFERVFWKRQIGTFQHVPKNERFVSDLALGNDAACSASLRLQSRRQIFAPM